MKPTPCAFRLDSEACLLELFSFFLRFLFCLEPFGAMNLTLEL